MEFVTLEALLAQTRALPTEPEMALLESYAETAEVMIKNYTYRTTEELMARSDDGKSIPAPIIQATLLMVGHWYENRSATTRQPLSMIALGIDVLLKPYRKFKRNWRS